MRLLLDTHIIVWWALGNPMLLPRERARIEDSANEIGVSVASIWEVATKNATSRREPIGVSAPRLLDLVARAEFQLLPVFAHQAEAIEGPPSAHGDPFDRLLVATAVVDGWRLLTHDKQLAAYGPTVILV